MATTLGKKVRVNSCMEVTAWKSDDDETDGQADDQHGASQLGHQHQGLRRQMENGVVVHRV